MPTKKITLEEIAHMAGVSIATVSRVINQNGRFSKETEKRVNEIIAKYNYRPNQMARGLRKNRGKVVGIIVPDVTNEFFAKMALEMQNRLLNEDYMAIICNTNESGDIERAHLSMLKSMLVSGLIYITHESIDTNHTLIVPTIYIDREPLCISSQEENVFIESENTEGGRQAVRHLVDQGCRRIALVCLEGQISSHHNRCEGYKRGLRESGISVDESLIYCTKAVTYEDGFEVTDELLREHPDVDGIFYTADILALGALQYCLKRNVNVPEDLKIIGFDDIAACTRSIPQLTTIHQSVDMIAELAVKNLVSMMDGNPVEKSYIKFPINVVVRGSTQL
ncbi:LacI family DNA-binding transcriptional regulator (plasmid) [Chloroflexota bacterium]|nr:LacI family DNA-binding transcriptional regulator [Chloroflexota bacterium]